MWARYVDRVEESVLLISLPCPLSTLLFDDVGVSSARVQQLSAICQHASTKGHPRRIEVRVRSVSAYKLCRRYEFTAVTGGSLHMPSKSDRRS